MVMGFGPPEGDPEVWSALDSGARAAGHDFCFAGALPGLDGDYAVGAFAPHPFIHQEMIEMLYHVLWETVHVFFEHRELGLDTGDAGFLYPFLGQQKQPTEDLLAEVAASIRLKVQDDAGLRAQVAAEQAEAIGATAHAIWQCVQRGGKLILFGNGGSATDANDWALDCVCPPEGYRPIPAVSLALEPANITAVANDVGTDVDLSAATHRASAPRRHGRGDFDQRRIAQHRDGAGGGAQAQAHHRRAAGLRRRRGPAPGPGGFSR